MKLSKYLLAILLLIISITVSHSQIRNRPDLNDYSIFKYIKKLTDDPIPVVRTNFQVTLRDGVKLDAFKFVPIQPPPSGGWPVVIMVHGYGDNKETLANFCQAQAEYGYYTSAFSVRGQGNSGGLSNLISNVEAQDLVEFIARIKADSVNGSNPNKILIMGGSQGGLLPMMAASRYNLNVKTIISALAPSDFATSWIENGCIKMTFLWTVVYPPANARYTPLVDRMSDWVYESKSKPMWDSLAYWLPRDRDFTQYIPNNIVPVLVEGSWQDKFFNAAGLIEEAELLNSQFRIYLGAVQGHGGDQSATEDQWHMLLFNDWFNQYLLNLPPVNPVFKYEYASTTYPLIGNKWTFIHGSSNTNIFPTATPLRLYFSRSGSLKTTIETGNDSVSLNNTVDSNLTMQQAVLYDFTGTEFNSKFTKANINFTTQVLAHDYKMLGIPFIKLKYSSTAGPFCQYNFQLYEVRPDDSQWLVNRINFTDRNYTSNQVRITNIRGQGHSHIFKAGNRIRIVLTNLDTSPADTTFMETNPFVLPVLINSVNKIFLNGNSYVDLPVLPITGLPNINEIINQNEYVLEGNYPNPFNPSTTIRLNINSTKKSDVKVSIFDILGKEVQILMNKPLSFGRYEAKWDASAFSSGIYFYSLAVDGVNYDTKKMLLIK